MTTSNPLQGQTVRIPTGCSGINQTIGGGFERGVITEICGESGVGKTQLCLQSCLATWAGMYSTSMYIATMPGFPIWRYSQMSRAYNVHGIPDEASLRSTMVRNIIDIDELSDFLHHLYTTLDNTGSSSKLDLIVFDSMAVYSRPCTSNSDLMAHCNRVSSFGYGLQRIAQKHNLAVVVCNKAVNGDNRSNYTFNSSGRFLKPAVGKPWDKYVTSRIVVAWEKDQSEVWQRVLLLSKGPGTGRKISLNIDSHSIKAKFM